MEKTKSRDDGLAGNKSPIPNNFDDLSHLSELYETTKFLIPFMPFHMAI